MEGRDLTHFPNRGNPNGFKLGGQGKDNKESGNYTRHNAFLQNCLAVGHRKKGFDQNNNAGQMTISHCLAIRNEINFGFSNPYPCTLDIRHCVSLEPTGGEHLATGPDCTITQEDNSWNGNENTPALDGIDIVQLILARRQADGSLPEGLQKILENL